VHNISRCLDARQPFVSIVFMIMLWKSTCSHLLEISNPSELTSCLSLAGCPLQIFSDQSLKLKVID